VSGWVKLHRKLLDNPRFQDGDWLKVWVWMLLTASHDGGKTVLFKGKRIPLKPGQFTAGRHQIALATGVSSSKVNRVLFALKSEQQIGQQTSNACSLFTITNWGSYQKSGQPNEQPVDSHRTAIGQPVDTNQEVKKGRMEEDISGEPPQDGLPLGDIPVVVEKKPRKQDPLFNKLADLCGMEYERMTTQSKKATAVALAGIRQAMPELTEDDLEQAVVNYRALYPGATVTPNALSKHWPTLGTARQTKYAPNL